MNPERRQKLIRATFILNGFLFLLGAWGLVQDQHWLFGGSQFLAAILNFVMLGNFKQERTKEWLAYAILLLNVIICASNAWLNIQAGTTYLQYPWMLAAFFTFLSFIIQLRKDQTRAKASTSEPSQL